MWSPINPRGSGGSDGGVGGGSDGASHRDAGTGGACIVPSKTETSTEQTGYSVPIDGCVRGLGMSVSMSVCEFCPASNKCRVVVCQEYKDEIPASGSRKP